MIYFLGCKSYFALMRKFILFLCLGFTISLQAQELQKFYNDAMAAYKAKNYGKFYECIKEAHKLRPTHQGILYQLGIDAALTNHDKEAIESLKQALLIDSDFKLEHISDFNSLNDTKEFKALLALQKEWQT